MSSRAGSTGTTNDRSQQARINPPKANRKLLFEFGAIILFIFLVYLPALKGEMLLDDLPNIRDNPYLKNLSSFEWIYKTEQGYGFSGRPLLQWSFALNRMLLGDSLWSYHIINNLIHIINALLLFLIAKITVAKIKLRNARIRFLESIPFVLALIWALNPIHVQSVTYLVQRAELLMALGLLGSVYFAIAEASGRRKKYYPLISICFALLSMATKEVGVVIPVLVLFHKWTFSKDSLKEILKSNRLLFTGYLVAWVLFISLTLSSTIWEVSSSSNLSGWEYLKVQALIIFYYVKTTLLPLNHVFDYHWEIFPGPIAGIFILSGHLLIMAMAFVLMLNRRAAGFFILAIYIILAPTCSIVPLPDLIYIHRFYLPSALVLLLMISGLIYVAGFLVDRKITRNDTSRHVLRVLFIGTAIMYSIMTISGNRLHQSSRAVWAKTVEANPHNARALNNLGMTCLEEQDPEQALGYFQSALKYNEREAHLPVIYFNLGNSYLDLNSYGNAYRFFTEAIQLEPEYWSAYVNRGIALSALKRFEEAAEDQRTALGHVKIDPNLYMQYAYSLYMLGSRAEAVKVLVSAESKGIIIPVDFRNALGI